MKASTQGHSTGFDGGKGAKGRKRHILVDTLGLILVVVVTAANSNDRKGLKALPHSFAEGAQRLRKSGSMAIARDAPFKPGWHN